MFLACTRPAMVAGVTMEAMALNVMFSCILFLVAGSIVYGLVALPIHGLCRIICRARPQHVPDSARLDRDPGARTQRHLLGRIVLHAAEARPALSNKGFRLCVTQRSKAREIEPDVYLPFGRHVTDTVISLTTRALLTVIRLDGTSFETAETSI